MKRKWLYIIQIGIEYFEVCITATVYVLYKFTAHMVYKVIVDFEVVQGVLYLRMKNISHQPVFQVKISFQPGFTGHSGKRNIPGLKIFENIPFMAPDKYFNILIDKFPVYLNRNEPTQIITQIKYMDEFEEVHEYELSHNLEIYRDLAELEY